MALYLSDMKSSIRFIPGKLYKCTNFYLIAYPTYAASQISASQTARLFTVYSSVGINKRSIVYSPELHAHWATKYWSDVLCAHVVCTKPYQLLMHLATKSDDTGLQHHQFLLVPESGTPTAGWIHMCASVRITLAKKNDIKSQ